MNGIKTTIIEELKKYGKITSQRQLKKEKNYALVSAIERYGGVKLFR